MFRKLRQRNPTTRAVALCDEMKVYQDKKTTEILTELDYVLQGIKDYLTIHQQEFKYISVNRVFMDKNAFGQDSFFFLINVTHSSDPKTAILITVGVPVEVCAKHDRNAVVDHLIDIMEAHKQRTDEMYDNLMKAFERENDELLDDLELDDVEFVNLNNLPTDVTDQLIDKFEEIGTEEQEELEEEPKEKRVLH